MKSYKGVKPDLQKLLDLRYQARGITFFKKQTANAVNAGGKLSKAKGRGMDFDEVRHYQAGDDIRLMHWSLTARLGKPYTKVYREERERSLYFILDQGFSMRFGTRECFKSVKAVEALALLGFGAISENEKVGGIVFDEKGYSFFPAKQDKSTLVRIFNQTIEDNKHYQVESSNGLEEALKILYSKVKSNSIIIILSDFSQLTKEAQLYLKLLTKNHEVVNIFNYDPIEKQLPDLGAYFFSDGKHRLEIDGANKKLREGYNALFTDRENNIKDFSKKHKMIFLTLATNDDLVKAINYGMMNDARS
ncbi:DUF58 domain-containing protein [Pseudofrancisella aestuarii]|uniref:DUF58 domain-containing protein n=1 Tax=Pseudofrancisella aestuarii TaxID=2670347 RepID=A0ABV9TCH0_9GAMM|nr:DUF58 domain-containing protein [Pseudofrancisella aestuarii]